MSDPESRVAICVDFGSTFTKALLVDLTDGTIAGAAEHPTTIGTDVLDGYDACLAALLDTDSRAGVARVLACSSAGGGLRIAVLGHEELVTAEAGRRVALSSGGKVAGVFHRDSDLTRLTALEPDVVLLTGGTDGGNSAALLDATRRLTEAGWRGPVVVAGNVEARDEAAALLDRCRMPVVLAGNVVPRIGVLAPDSARAAIRQLFLSHVIGGKHLSARADFVAMVRGATPDVVLSGVELLARGLDPSRHGADYPGAGDVVVVDIGGATTDVHSVVDADPEDAQSGLGREVVASTPVTRTVEGDLGMRWSAVHTVTEAGLDELTVEAERRRADPALLPIDDEDLAVDEAIARAAIGLALRRHAGRSRVVVGPGGRVVERSGTDLREVDLLVGSGGALRNGRAGVLDRVLSGVGEVEGGWQLPRAPHVVVDHDHVLAAAGLLVGKHPQAAYGLIAGLRKPFAPRPD